MVGQYGNIVLDGLVEVEVSRRPSQWSTKHLRLYEQAIVYSDTDGEGRPTIIQIVNIDFLKSNAANGDSPGQQYSSSRIFSIVSGNAMWTLRWPSIEEAERWRTSIQNVIDMQAPVKVNGFGSPGSSPSNRRNSGRTKVATDLMRTVLFLAHDVGVSTPDNTEDATMHGLAAAVVAKCMEGIMALQLEMASTGASSARLGECAAEIILLEENRSCAELLTYAAADVPEEHRRQVADRAIQKASKQLEELRVIQAKPGNSPRNTSYYVQKQITAVERSLQASQCIAALMESEELPRFGTSPENYEMPDENSSPSKKKTGISWGVGLDITSPSVAGSRGVAFSQDTASVSNSSNAPTTNASQSAIGTGITQSSSAQEDEFGESAWPVSEFDDGDRDFRRSAEFYSLHSIRETERERASHFSRSTVRTTVGDWVDDDDVDGSMDTLIMAPPPRENSGIDLGSADKEIILGADAGEEVIEGGAIDGGVTGSRRKLDSIREVGGERNDVSWPTSENATPRNDEWKAVIRQRRARLLEIMGWTADAEAAAVTARKQAAQVVEQVRSDYQAEDSFLDSIFEVRSRITKLREATPRRRLGKSASKLLSRSCSDLDAEEAESATTEKEHQGERYYRSGKVIDVAKANCLG